MTREYARRVGEQLRKVRHQQQYSLQAVEAASSFEFKASVLGAYERGERAISVARLQRLAAFYKVPVDQLLPRSSGTAKPSPTEPRDKLTLDLTKLDAAPAPYGDLLTRYVEMIQVERQDFNRYVLTLRRDDVEAISRMLGTSSGELRDWLQELGLRS
ncbi:MAG: transcriptional regulator [Acidimicrobiaceae bacterium]|nr:transcriptional regulator [Acidimicrobiaceae bacterium]